MAGTYPEVPTGSPQLYANVPRGDLKMPFLRQTHVNPGAAAVSEVKVPPTGDLLGAWWLQMFHTVTLILSLFADNGWFLQE